MGKNIDNTYSTDAVSSSADGILDVMKGLVEKVNELTTLNEFANKRNICNDEFIKMLSSGNIYEHTKEPYDDKYDTEVITEEQDIDDNGRSFIPVTIKVYKKGDKVAYTRKENVYPVTIFDTDEKVGIILKNDKYKMMDIYPTSGPQTTKYNTMLEPPDKFNTKKLTTMEQMFYRCEKMAKADVSNFNTSKVTNMSYMFNGCNKLTTLDLSNFNTSKVKNMSNVFYNCSGLTTVDLTSFDTSQVTNMGNMFYNCPLLGNIPKLNASKVTIISSFADYCKSLTDFGGLENLGQAYSTRYSANYAGYKLDLSQSSGLTEQSLINVLTNLYDIKTKGCKTQQVVLGSTNLAKLTSEEGQQALSNSQAKGWSIS